MIFSNFAHHFPPTMLCGVLFNVTGVLGQSIQRLRKQERTGILWRNNCDHAELNAKTCLEHGFDIEYTYFQWL